MTRVRYAITRTSGPVCFTGLAVFLVALAAEHLLQPGLDVRDHRISEYVNTDTGWVMVIGFAGWAAGLAGAAVTVWRARPGPANGAVATGLAIASIGIIVVAVFPTQTSAAELPPGTELTWTGRAHDLGSAAAFLAMVIAAAIAASTDATWRHPLVMGPLVAGGTVLLGMAVLGVDAPGIRQRLLVLAAVTWLAAGAHALLRQAPGTSPPSTR